MTPRPPRRMPGGWVEPETLATGATGRPLCRYCNLEIPPGRRRTFCSPYCVHEWKLRTDPGYLRDCVLERDKGVCALCGADTLAEYRRLRRVHYNRRPAALAQWGLQKLNRRSLWDADHIVPVVEGGGECDLDNLRTLCLKCHRQATAELRFRGAAPRP